MKIGRAEGDSAQNDISVRFSGRHSAEHCGGPSFLFELLRRRVGARRCLRVVLLTNCAHASANALSRIHAASIGHELERRHCCASVQRLTPFSVPMSSSCGLFYALGDYQQPATLAGRCRSVHVRSLTGSRGRECIRWVIRVRCQCKIRFFEAVSTLHASIEMAKKDKVAITEVSVGFASFQTYVAGRLD